MSASPANNTKTQSKMMVTDEVVIEISNMNKWFGHFHVLRDIDLIVNNGDKVKGFYQPAVTLTNPNVPTAGFDYRIIGGGK